jgi:hypothetical protein
MIGDRWITSPPVCQDGVARTLTFFQQLARLVGRESRRTGCPGLVRDQPRLVDAAIPWDAAISGYAAEEAEEPVG